METPIHCCPHFPVGWIAGDASGSSRTYLSSQLSSLAFFPYFSWLDFKAVFKSFQQLWEKQIFVAGQWLDMCLSLYEQESCCQSSKLPPTDRFGFAIMSENWEHDNALRKNPERIFAIGEQESTKVRRILFKSYYCREGGLWNLTVPNGIYSERYLWNDAKWCHTHLLQITVVSRYWLLSSNGVQTAVQGKSEIATLPAMHITPSRFFLYISQTRSVKFLNKSC